MGDDSYSFGGFAEMERDELRNLDGEFVTDLLDRSYGAEGDLRDRDGAEDYYLTYELE